MGTSGARVRPSVRDTGRPFEAGVGVDDLPAPATCDALEHVRARAGCARVADEGRLL